MSGAAAAQPALPGVGGLYPRLAGYKAVRGVEGRLRLRRYLLLAAMHELSGPGTRPQDRTYDAVTAKSKEIWLRHYPRARKFAGLAERTIRDDFTSLWIYRFFRGLSRPLRVPVDPAARAMTLPELRHAYAVLEARCAKVEAKLKSAKDAAVIAEIGGMLLASGAVGSDMPELTDDGDDEFAEG